LSDSCFTIENTSRKVYALRLRTHKEQARCEV